MPNVTNNALEIDMQDRFRELAVIDWHLTESSKLRYDGMELDLSEFLPPQGFLGLVGRSGYLFIDVEAAFVDWQFFEDHESSKRQAVYPTNGHSAWSICPWYVQARVHIAYCSPLL